MIGGEFKIRRLSDDTVEALIYDDIGEGFFSGIGAERFAHELNEAGDFENINVRINSPGGVVFDAVAIYNTLNQHEANVDVFIDGLAASAASIIAMVGNEISIAENGLIMIHDPWTIAMGDAAEMRKTADTLDVIGDTIVATYDARVGDKTDRETIAQMMHDETWMKAEQAVEQGFATSIMEAKRPATDKKLFAKFKNVPKELMELAEADEKAARGIGNDLESLRAKITQQAAIAKVAKADMEKHAAENAAA